MNCSKQGFVKEFNVSRETLEKLVTYEALLKKWQASVNLISPNTVDDIWHRHFYDSAQLLPYIKNNDNSIVDMGAGAGFPGLVLSCLGCQNVTLIESDTKKCLFLKEVVRQLNLDAMIENRRIEACHLTSDIVTARAFAPLDRLLSFYVEKAHEKSKGLFLKGKTYQSEIEEARKNWSFDYDVFKSVTSEGGVILEIKNVSRET